MAKKGLYTVLLAVALFGAGFACGLLVQKGGVERAAVYHLAAQSETACRETVQFSGSTQQEEPEKRAAKQQAPSRSLRAARQEADSGQRRQSLFWQTMAQVRDLGPSTLTIGDLQPEQLEEAISQFNDDELLDLIGTYTQLAANDLPEGVAIAEAAQRLGELYYSEEEEREETPLDDPGYAVPVSFGLSTRANNQVVEAKNSFPPETKRIYASFPSENYKERTIMVKWSCVGEVLLYKKFSINPGMEYNYVWLEQSPWLTGSCRFRAYGTNGNFPLIATGGYEVAEQLAN